MKPLEILIALIFFLSKSYGQGTAKQQYVNPTGYYELKGQEKGGETYGYFGFVRVKLIPNSRVVVAFSICKGYKSYNSGEFYDTLAYVNNRATYKTPEMDSSCRIELLFTSKGVKVDETAADFNNGCGFGHGVVAKAFYRRISRKVPSEHDMSFY